MAFDIAAAGAYVTLFAIRRQLGRPIAISDLMFAAIACAYGTSIVRRNTRDFEGCGVTIGNPCELP